MYKSLLRNASSDAPAIYFQNKTITHREMHKNIRRMIAYFAKLGVREGDVVTVSLPNIPSSIYALYALNALGAVQNIIHPLSPASEIIRTSKETSSVLTVVLSTLYKEHGKQFADNGIKTAFANPMYDVSLWTRTACNLKYGKIAETDMQYDMEHFRKEKANPFICTRDTSLPCIYLHSGGTTDVPKIIELSADALNNLVAKADTIVPHGFAGKSAFAVLPMFHGFGLAMGIHAPLFHGAACALMTKFDAKKTVGWINEGKISFILGVPLLYQKLMKEPSFADSKLQNIDCAFVGGDNVPPSLITAFDALMAQKGFEGRMLEGYGLTETVTVCTVNTIAQTRAGSVGKALHGITLSVRDENGKSLPCGEPGEVYIAGDTLMNGYYRDAGATARTLVEYDGITWVRSGDLGTLDQDGFLYLKSRIKRVFKIAGINIYPSEVEKIATDLQDDVRDAALELFETPKPHLTLFLIKNRTSTRTDEEIKADILQRIETRLLKYCVPDRIVFLESFPQTKVGKTDHKAFRNMEKTWSE
ncbi:MAG: acyl--CoA ligase [Clostridia bacterium]|nr:acyl--CoA ligase [Clostridia bacterium]